MYNSITVRILLINGEGASLLANGYWTAPLRYQKEGVVNPWREEQIVKPLASEYWGGGGNFHRQGASIRFMHPQASWGIIHASTWTY